MNVLLYVMDAVRADHVSCYGYDRETTPHLDGIASQGVRFDNCYAPATWTRPVAASLLSGLYPPAHGTRTREDGFDPPRPSLAERLGAAGYDTVGITTMGNVSTTMGFDRGFGEFHDLYKDPAIVERRRSTTAGDEELHGEDGAVALPRAEDITETFRDWYDRRTGGPFFAFCWSIEPHIPYDPPDGYDRYRDTSYRGPATGEREDLPEVTDGFDIAQLAARYDEELRYNDDCIGDLVSVLEDVGELEETLLVVVGDHGEGFGDHDRLTHGHAPYEELVRVPMIMRGPADRRGGSVVEGLTSLVDVYPTVLEHATDIGTSEAPPPVGGRSQAGVLTGGGPDPHDAVYFETKPYDIRRSFHGVRTSRYKYISIEQPGADPGSLLELARSVLAKGVLTNIVRNPVHYWQRYWYEQSELLFDLDADPDEQRNLATDAEEPRRRLAELLADWLERCEQYVEAEDTSQGRADIDEGTAEQLRALGYGE